MVDARGLACPIPVLMTQKELAKGADSVEVMVDNFAARENVTRLAESKGFAPYRFGDKVKKGGRYYYNNRGKSLYLFTVGEEPLESGMAMTIEFGKK